MKNFPSYLEGFGNHHSSEAIKGSLPPLNRNSPQQCPLGLYAEQVSGTAFTAPRHDNQKVWLYRIRPSVVCHSPFAPLSPQDLRESGSNLHSPPPIPSTPIQLRWSPFTPPSTPSPSTPLDFIKSLRTVGRTGDPALRLGIAVHVYAATASMGPRQAMQNSDGDFLVVVQDGGVVVETEMGVLHVAPGEIFVVPRGIRFAVQLEGAFARGYVLEVYNRHFELPELGPIGSNGLANPRDFLYPTAAFRDEEYKESDAFTLYNKYQNHLHTSKLLHCPFDVVAWHGNYAPYKYDLSRFNTINTVSFDHPDPSIFTVLTVKSGEPGVALADFVIFPPRWMVAMDTFRPPWFHRNCMSEFMGLIKGTYDAKDGDGFMPGGASLHSIGTPHGPDAASFDKGSTQLLQPVQTDPNGLAFMFESNLMIPTQWALSQTSGLVQEDYWKCWQGLEKRFVNPNV